ncbi:MAG: Glycyl-tRNA synthetase [candidate division TM6 bacterium GW2011_GWE2_41_16]|nr:MAG: Glycyl-tRNA synthetase [candidate division TM6 bacterium GW2011_GWE2_41_16]
MTRESKATLEKITALCKHRGFIYPSCDIYGGINGIYDTGPLGLMLKNNLKRAWKKFNNAQVDTILYMDGALIGSQALWEASGHISNFNDPMVDCLNCKHRYRTDEITLDGPCPHCGQTKWTEVRQFNMMFATNLGASSDQSSVAYLRPETAQTIFSQFKNIASSYRAKLPFGIAQIGKSFRNEITPKQFLFRLREFEQMELEWFCAPEEAHKFFELWRHARYNFYKTIGINPEHVRVRNHDKEELSHYSSATSDVEYLFPFGWKELEGIAYRGDFDLTQHSTFSKKDLSYFDEAAKRSYMPHVVESSVGVDRLFLVTMFEAYDEETIQDGDKEDTRVVLRFHPTIAPIKCAVLSLTKKQSDQARVLFTELKKAGIDTVFDEAGSIGKRYRRYDEIGVPYCITFDFDTEKDASVTIRERDSMKQERIAIADVQKYIHQKTTYKPEF